MGKFESRTRTVPRGRDMPPEFAVPDHDLVALWEAHCRYEFETHDVNSTMATMVDAPYVNNIPTMTGGVGHDQVKRFYKYHFIDANAAGTETR